MPGIVGSTPEGAVTTAQQGTVAATLAMFSNDVAKATGFDPRVIYAQGVAEGAFASNSTGGYDFLNLRTGTVSSLGDTYASASSGGFAQFADLASAEKATEDEFKSQAISLGLGTKNLAAPTVSGQISQLAASPWDAGHYGGAGGPKLLATFASLFPGTSAATSAGSAALTGTGGGVAPTTSTSSVGGTLDSIPGVSDLSSIGSAFTWIFQGKNITRVGEVLAGVLLVIIGIIALVHGASIPAAAGTVARVGR